MARSREVALHDIKKAKKEEAAWVTAALKVSIDELRSEEYNEIGMHEPNV